MSFSFTYVELVDDSRLDARNRIGLRVVGESRYDRARSEGGKAKGGCDAE